MTSIVKLTAVSGAMGESPPCYLLQIDDFRVLLDTGWDENFDPQFIRSVAKLAPKVDAVLLSHSDTYHLGALPYLVSKCGLNCPVYATVPVWKMGQMFMYDLYLNHHNSRNFNLFDLDDVDAAFDKIVQLEYNQVVGFKGKGHGISVTPIPAGHTLGGAVWRIARHGEEDIYYAIDHNNKKERHLNGFELDGVKRGSLLITNSLNSLYVQEKRRKRDEELMATLQTTLRMGGNVLIATDTAGRALELTLMLDQMWRSRDSGLALFSLVLLNNVAFNVLEFAKEQIPWMSEKLQKSYESTRTNPFQLKHVVVAHTLIELAQIASPKVVITSPADLESGFSRDLFLQWCQDPHSAVVLTYRSSPGTLARNLIDLHKPGMTWSLDVRQKVRTNDTKQGGGNNNFGEARKRRWDEVGRDQTGSTKFLCVRENFTVNCSVRFIDFEGRSDVEAMVKVVSEVMPKRIVLVRGDCQSTVAMGGLCQRLLGDEGVVLMPKVGDVVRLSDQGVQVVQVTLTDPLVSALNMHKLRGMELAWLEGQVEEEQHENNKKTDQGADSDAATARLVIPKKARLDESPRAHHPLFVNRLRLSEFKQILSNNGIESEYDRGVLTVRCSTGVVYIQRHSDSKELVVEADGLTEEYYRIRELLYAQFAII